MRPSVVAILYNTAPQCSCVQQPSCDTRRAKTLRTPQHAAAYPTCVCRVVYTFSHLCMRKECLRAPALCARCESTRALAHGLSSYAHTIASLTCTRAHASHIHENIIVINGSDSCVCLCLCVCMYVCMNVRLHHRCGFLMVCCYYYLRTRASGRRVARMRARMHNNARRVKLNNIMRNRTDEKSTRRHRARFKIA